MITPMNRFSVIIVPSSTNETKNSAPSTGCALEAVHSASFPP
jgi:hypothetical protein